MRKSMRYIACTMAAAMLVMSVQAVPAKAEVKAEGSRIISEAINLTAATGIRLSVKKTTMWTGKSLQLKVYGTTRKPVWKTGNKEIATVSKNGKVTAKGPGTVSISATVGNTTVVCKIKVRQPSVTGLKFKKKIVVIEQGKTYKSQLNVTPKNVTKPLVSWSSSSREVATVAGDGTVTAIAEGKAKITAKKGGISDYYYVYVKRGELDSISFKNTTVALKSGESYYQDVISKPVGYANEEFSWQSSNGDVATVKEDGTVIAGNTAGTAMIIATYTDPDTDKVLASSYYTVNVSLGEIQDFSFEKSNVTMFPGELFTPSITTAPLGYALTDFTWRSENTGVAKVLSDGRVQAVGNGTTNIIATRDNVSRSFTVNVAVGALSADKTSLNLVYDSNDNTNYGSGGIIHITNPSRSSLYYTTPSGSSIECSWADPEPNSKGASKDGAESADLIVRAGSARVTNILIYDNKGHVLTIPVNITNK